VQEKIDIIDPQGQKVGELNVREGPYHFELETVSGPKNYTLKIIYKRSPDGEKDPQKIKGAMLQ